MSSPFFLFEKDLFQLSLHNYYEVALERSKSTNGSGFLDSAYIMATKKPGAPKDLQVQIHTLTLPSEDALKII